MISKEAVQKLSTIWKFYISRVLIISLVILYVGSFKSIFNLILNVNKQSSMNHKSYDSIVSPDL